MRVRASKTGYFNGLHIPDTDSAEFNVPNGSKATWFEPIKDSKKAAKADDAPADPGSPDSLV